MDILYQDNRIAVCLKPPGVLSTDEPGGMPSLLRAALGTDFTTAINAQAIVIGLCFANGLSPVAGKYGWWAGIVFGVLHLLASCMLLFGLTRGFWEALPAWVLPVLCLALIFLTAPCADGVTTQTPQLWLFGFTTPDFASADYFPLLPWFFVFLLGTWAGRYVKAGRLPQWFYTARAPRLALVGRHALLLYVLHQPLLYALTMLLRLIFIR